MIDYNKFEPVIINDEVTNYAMNRNGVMINVVSGCIIKPHIKKNGRANYTISHKHKKIEMTKARWLAMMFIPLPEGYTMDELEADHINGDHTDDRFENIQWLTPDDNRRKSYTQDGNLFIGELNGASKLKEKTVIKIVKDLSKGKTPKELSEKYGVKASAIIDIKIGRIWKHISKDYDLEKFITRRKDVQRYSQELKDNVYNIISDNPYLKPNEICKLLNIEYCHKMRCLINSIRRKMYDKGSTTIENSDEYYTIDIPSIEFVDSKLLDECNEYYNIIIK